MSFPTSYSSYKTNYYPSGQILGFSAIALTIILWASWIISMKFGLDLSLSLFDLALLRYGLPFIVFGYFTYKLRHIIVKAKAWHLICICLGAGFPFLFFVAWGMEFSPASHAGILVPGTFPLFVSLINYFRSGKVLAAQYWVGIGCISLGISILIIPTIFMSGDFEILKGYFLYLSASFLWSLYTVAVHESRIPPLAAGGLFSGFSCIVLFFLYIFGVADTNFTYFLSPSIIESYLLVALVQGVLVGVLASFCYVFAISKLGAQKTTTLSSLTPALVVIMSAILLHEPFEWMTCLAVFTVCSGVAITNF